MCMDNRNEFGETCSYARFIYAEILEKMLSCGLEVSISIYNKPYKNFTKKCLHRKNE